MVITCLELQVLTGVILPRLHRFGQDLQWSDIHAVSQTGKLTRRFGVLLQADRHHRPGIYRRQALVHIVLIGHILG
ncbi:hypothetical protein D3C75_812720 [compost metagenome]